MTRLLSALAAAAGAWCLVHASALLAQDTGLGRQVPGKPIGKITTRGDLIVFTLDV